MTAGKQMNNLVSSLTWLIYDAEFNKVTLSFDYIFHKLTFIQTKCALTSPSRQKTEMPPSLKNLTHCSNKFRITLANAVKKWRISVLSCAAPVLEPAVLRKGSKGRKGPTCLRCFGRDLIGVCADAMFAASGQLKRVGSERLQIFQ